MSFTAYLFTNPQRRARRIFLWTIISSHAHLSRAVRLAMQGRPRHPAPSRVSILFLYFHPPTQNKLYLAPSKPGPSRAGDLFDSAGSPFRNGIFTQQPVKIEGAFLMIAIVFKYTNLLLLKILPCLHRLPRLPLYLLRAAGQFSVPVSHILLLGLHLLKPQCQCSVQHVLGPRSTLPSFGHAAARGSSTCTLDSSTQCPRQHHGR